MKNKSKIITTNSKSLRNNSPLFTKKTKKKNPRKQNNIWTNHWPVIGINVHEKKRSINLLMAIPPRNFSNCILDRDRRGVRAPSFSSTFSLLLLPDLKQMFGWREKVDRSNLVPRGRSRGKRRSGELPYMHFEVSNHGERDYSGRKKVPSSDSTAKLLGSRSSAWEFLWWFTYARG